MTRSPRDLAQQKIQLRKQQEALLRDLLTVVDALDHAADHWHQADNPPSSPQKSPPSSRPNSSPNSSPTAPGHAAPRTGWQRWRQWFSQCPLVAPAPPAPPPAAALTDVVASARQGIDLIRESMLTVLSQHQIVPLPALGHPFDPSQMHALGQRVDAACAPNIVVQEVVRGYRWQDRVLREAQVIVAVPPSPAQPE